MVARLMWRGARPSIETARTGEGETVVTVMIRLREPPTKQPGGRVCCGVGCGRLPLRYPRLTQTLLIMSIMSFQVVLC